MIFRLATRGGPAHFVFTLLPCVSVSVPMTSSIRVGGGGGRHSDGENVEEGGSRAVAVWAVVPKDRLGFRVGGGGFIAGGLKEVGAGGGRGSVVRQGG
jgi:hypothetical protein